MDKIHVLSSGSKANAIALEENGRYILIDQGLSFKRFREKCSTLGIALEKIAALLVTHEHTDHIQGIPLTASELGIPVFASPQVIPVIAEKSKRYNVSFFPLTKERLNIIQGFSVTPFSIMHDALDPLGFSFIFASGEKVAVATDTGKITAQMMRHIQGSSHVVIEANHDPVMLYKNERYSWELKQRIKSSYGHLSNAQCLETIEQIECGLKSVIMAHLSEENNSPKLLHSMISEYREKRLSTFNSFIASQHEPFSVLMI